MGEVNIFWRGVLLLFGYYAAIMRPGSLCRHRTTNGDYGAPNEPPSYRAVEHWLPHRHRRHRTRPPHAQPHRSPCRRVWSRGSAHRHIRTVEREGSPPRSRCVLQAHRLRRLAGLVDVPIEALRARGVDGHLAHAAERAHRQRSERGARESRCRRWPGSPPP